MGGILLGKSSRCSELGISFHIAPDSFCGPLEGLDNISLVIIIGNLIDNAMEAVLDLPRDRRKVDFGIYDESNRILINVRDTGCGIEPEIVQKIFDRGFSSKTQAPDRGYGLYNVRTRVDFLNGDIEMDSVPGEYTEFVVSLPNGGEENDT